MYAVNQLAKMSGVSVRTLHFYDEIGLLKPAWVGEQGYRFYNQKQLLDLQQILFYKELGFELKQIQTILKQSDQDRIATLSLQKELMQKKYKNMKTLLKTIDNTIEQLKGKQMINDKELFKGFDINSEKQKQYEKEVEEYLTQKYGSKKTKEILSNTNKDVKNWTKEDWQRSSERANAFCKELVKLIDKNAKSESLEVQNVIAKHYQWIKQFWIHNRESYAGHADFILETELRKFYDNYHPKLAQFIAEGIKIFANKELSN